MGEYLTLDSVKSDVDRLMNLISSFPEFINSRHKALSRSLISPEYVSLMDKRVSDLTKNVKRRIKLVEDTIRNLMKSQEWKVLNVGFFGETNAGKSTIIEALSCGDGSSIGDGRKDYTKEVVVREANINGFTLRLIDMPGIEGNEKKVQDKIRSAVNPCHIVFFVSGAGREVERGTLEKLRSYLNERALVFCVLNRRSNIQMFKYTKELLNEDIVKVVSRVHKQMKSVFGKHYGGEVIVVDALLAFLCRGRFRKPFFGFLGRKSKYAEYREKVLQIFERESELIAASGVQKLLTKLYEACGVQKVYIFKYNTIKVLREIKDCLLSLEKEIETFADNLSVDRRIYRVLEDLKIEFRNVKNRIKVNTCEILDYAKYEMVRYGCSMIDAGNNDFSINMGEYIGPKLNKIAEVIKTEVEHFTKSAQRELKRFKISDTPQRDPLSISMQPLHFEASGLDALWDILKGGMLASLAVGKFFGPIGIIVAFAAGGLFSLFMSEEDRRANRKKVLVERIDAVISDLTDNIMREVNAILNPIEAKLDAIIKLLDEEPKKIMSYVNDLKGKLREIMNTVDNYGSRIENLTVR